MIILVIISWTINSTVNDYDLNLKRNSVFSDWMVQWKERRRKMRLTLVEIIICLFLINTIEAKLVRYTKEDIMTSTWFVKTVKSDVRSLSFDFTDPTSNSWYLIRLQKYKRLNVYLYKLTIFFLIQSENSTRPSF